MGIADKILALYDELMERPDDGDDANQPMHVLAWCLATIAKRHCAAQLGAPCTCHEWLHGLWETIEYHREFAPESQSSDKLTFNEC